jgi:hypothetical protein
MTIFVAASLNLNQERQPLQADRSKATIALAAALALSACATTAPSAGAPGTNSAATPATVGQRDLTPEEKKIIVAAVAPNLRDPGSAKYRWAKFPEMTTQDSVNYCATVDAKSPFPAYDGRQAYIVEAKVLGGRVISATMGLIAGGKDAALVAKMCAKYDLDPNKAI